MSRFCPPRIWEDRAFWRRSSSAPPLLARLANGTTTISTCSLTALWSAHHEGRRCAGGHGMDVDARLRLPRGPHTNPRLRADARGRDGSIREELAAGVTARARRADRQVESAAWTARGGL